MASKDWSLLMSDLINRVADWFSHNFSRHPSSSKTPSPMPDWTSLPPELINCIACCFLATGDLDYYIDFRAVCTAWRSATDNPKNATDNRFCPRRWILLHEVFETDVRLLVNTATGRILHKDLPLLRIHNYRHVATAIDGLLVLADKDAPHLVHVLNPFTGGMTDFAAPLPPCMVSAALVVGSSPTLVLLLDWTRELYWADPTSKSFVLYEGCVSYPLVRLAGMCGMYTGIGQELAAAPRAAAMVDKISDLLRSFAIDPSEIFASKRCFLVEDSAGELFLVVKVPQRMEVFKVDMERVLLEPVKSIGSRAIFLGHRCLCINADNFVSVEANFIYNTDPHSSDDFYMYDLEKEKQERITRSMMDEYPPFTIIELLSIYTFNLPGFELQWAQREPGAGCVIL